MLPKGSRSDSACTKRAAAMQMAEDANGRRGTGAVRILHGFRAAIVFGSAVDEATLDGNHDRVGSVVCLKLGEDVLHVTLHRVLGDEELVGHDLIRGAAGYLSQHLGFALRERVGAVVVRNLGGDL